MDDDLLPTEALPQSSKAVSEFELVNGFSIAIEEISVENASEQATSTQSKKIEELPRIPALPEKLKTETISMQELPLTANAAISMSNFRDEEFAVMTQDKILSQIGIEPNERDDDEYEFGTANMGLNANSASPLAVTFNPASTEDELDDENVMDAEHV